MRTLAITLAAILLVPLLAAPLAAAVEGIVTTPEGKPLEGARVHLLPDGPDRLTDGRGRFAFPEADPPARVLVVHSRFDPLEAEIPVAGGPPRLAVEPKQEIFEEIVVSATRESEASFQPVSIATASVTPIDRPAPATTLVEMVEGTPGVAESGQGGLFQAYSIRGIAGQRVMTLISGVRIITERRAGATASFLDPQLIASADVVRGPSSSYYGSGALGGLLQVFPQRYDDLSFTAGYSSQGDEAYQQLGFAAGGWSIGLAHREAGDAETADGERLFSRFEQWSGSLARTWSLEGGSTLDLLLVPTVGRDIGKPNTRFPDERVTLYPEENHLVGRLSLATPEGWRFDLLAHPNELRTRDVDSEEIAVVDNESFDLGLGAQRELDLPAGFSGRVGLDWFGRRDVGATEVTEELATGDTTTATTLDGRQDELGAYGSARRSLGRVILELGGRFTWIEQANSGAETTSDTAWSGFAGATLPLDGGFELVLNLGTGLRFPGLSERFFTGTTGRGEVIANADLEPERSLSLDLGLRYYGDRLYGAVYVYRNEIDDYIERISLAPGVRTFVNLTSGTIEGVELDGFYQLSDALRLTWAAQRSRGEDDAGQALSDIAADRVEAGLRWTAGPWTAAGRLQHRFAKEAGEIGSGEKETGSAEVLSASVSHRFENGLTLHVTGDNLLDEQYLPSADELAVAAPGRSVGVAVGWEGG